MLAITLSLIWASCAVAICITIVRGVMGCNRERLHHLQTMRELEHKREQRLLGDGRWP